MKRLKAGDKVHYKPIGSRNIVNCYFVERDGKHRILETEHGVITKAIANDVRKGWK